MNIALLAVDSNYPNLALMKISAYHKRQGDVVEWYNPFDQYDILYMAKVFSFTPDYEQWILNTNLIIKGGTGYDLHSRLDKEIEYVTPDYSIYPSVKSNEAYGFLTRGCPNHCPWCVVPQKEGKIAPYMDIEQIAVDGRNEIILMDNNVLASDFGLQQIEKIIRMNEGCNGRSRPYIKVDFNQALDARLVTEDIAKMLARLKWIKRIRFGCDTPGQITECDRAIDLIDKYGYKGEYFLYCILLGNIKECHERVTHWKHKGTRFIPHCQPYRDINNPKQVIPQWQKDLAHWADRKVYFRSCEFKDFEVRKGFKCIEHFY